MKFIQKQPTRPESWWFRPNVFTKKAAIPNLRTGLANYSRQLSTGEARRWALSISTWETWM